MAKINRSTTRTLTYAVPLKLTPAIAKQVADAVKTTGLKKSDLLRMSVERGLSVLLAQLSSGPVQPERSEA